MSHALKRLSSVILFVCLWTSSARSLVLEDLIQAGKLESTLKNMRVGYYIGSFDPLHIGHENVAKLSIQQGLCDYVFILPAWGGDSWKKRVNVSLRQDMLFAVFQNHPRVIVTRLTPKEVQEILTIPDTCKLIVKPSFDGMSFIGIIGSDTALWLHSNAKEASKYMTGIPITEEYKKHTWGGCMALPVISFIVALREGDELNPLKGKVGDRNIITTIESETGRTLSSTAVKKALKSGLPIHAMASEPVRRIIEENRLYKCRTLCTE